MTPDRKEILQKRGTNHLYPSYYVFLWSESCRQAKEDLHRKFGFFILPIVSAGINVFIVTWLKYAEEELTYSLALTPDWLTKS